MHRVASFFEMVIPATALAKVMGKGGTNIDNIRKVSLGKQCMLVIPFSYASIIHPCFIV